MVVSKLEVRALGNTGLKLNNMSFGVFPLDNVFSPVFESDIVVSICEAFVSEPTSSTPPCNDKFLQSYSPSNLQLSNLTHHLYH
ncbi:hypothetical protein V6N13_094300 [Hibiscus sabdariffa]